MIGANKILTVSYGTFSCTLEGFDDPFTTMKAIAEYFRDLAAEDRFFGAEPPTPDAAMLHRIAEKEVQRRVEAKINENGVILRAGHAVTADPALPEPEAPAAAPPPTVESVAARLTRIRSAVAPEQMAEPEAAPAAADPADDALIAALHLADDDLAPLRAEPEADFGSEADLVALTAAMTAQPMADDFDEDYAEAGFDTAAAFAELPDLDPALAATAPDALPEHFAQPLDEPPEEFLPEYLDSDQDSELAAAAAGAVPQDETPLVDLVAGIVADVDESARALTDRIHRARARVIRISQPAESATPPQAETPTPPPVAAEPTPRSAIRPTRPARTLLHPAAPPAEDIPPVAATEDNPMTHAQFSEPAESEGEAAVSRLLAETNSQMAGVENRRRLSAIQHLKAAVAATVAERRAGAAKPVNEDDRTDPYRSVLSRMMRPGRETEEGQADPQARLLEPPVAAPATPSPLVLVLEQRVDALPRDPAPAPAPAPVLLTDLVTREEDEILAEFEDEAGIEADAALFTDTRGFAEFAGRLGADSLPAMLEAAAAYAACTEGRPHFSRPQIMRQVTAMAGDSSSREDALRSFGALLRTGRIVKVKRGQYALSDSNNVLAEARKLVG